MTNRLCCIVNLDVECRVCGKKWCAECWDTFIRKDSHNDCKCTKDSTQELTFRGVDHEGKIIFTREPFRKPERYVFE